MNLKKIDTSNQPLAGRLSEIGQQILLLGSKKAGLLCTGNWGETLFEDKKGTADSRTRPNFTKITDFDCQNYVEVASEKKKRMNRNTELDRLNRALKNGRITPLDGELRNNSVSMTTQGLPTLEKNFMVYSSNKPESIRRMELPELSERMPFEIKVSPKREELLRRIKQNRSNRNEIRKLNSTA